MKKHLLLCLLMIPVLLNGQIILEESLSERITNYKMDVVLDTEAKTVSGEMVVSWKNPSQDTVDHLQFHLYLNAFKNSKSTFYNEGRLNQSKEMEWGYIDVKSITSLDGENMSSGMRFIEPDQPVSFRDLHLPDETLFTPQERHEDETVLYLPLENPVLPDSTVTLKINFTSKLPKLHTRTGFADDYFFVAQWFPKLGVYESAGMRNTEDGAWNCHQFHRNSEFYANHSLYEVDITLPTDYVVGTGGVLMHEKSLPDGTRKLSYRAEDIVDFAWTASQDYVLVEDQWQHVKIQALFQPEHAYQADRHLESLRGALEYFEKHLGPYPWPHVTLIDPPTKGQAAGGMEYTTLFTAGTAYGLPYGLKMPELVTVHEFGHAYFMGILASNEFEEPWMDEGMNTYWEGRIMDHLYGENRGVIDTRLLHVGDVEFARLFYTLLPNQSIADGFRPAWEYPHGSYGTIIYQKTATWLHTLERMIGQVVMDEIFQEYYQRWAFKHPGSEDFIAIVNELVPAHHGDKFGTDLNWFFDQFLKSDKTLDYRVSGIYDQRFPEPRGFFGKGTSKKFEGETIQEGQFRTVVGLERMGEAIVPVEVLIHFEDGSEIIENWDGIDRAKDLIYEGTSPVEWVHIDPELKLLMDTNLMNNSYTRNPSKKSALKYGSKFLFLIQNILQLTSIIS